MDPYLEAHWLDVHTSLVTGARDALNACLPDDLVASAEERIAVESQSGEDSLLGPDVRVFEPPAAATAFAERPAGWVEGPYRLTAQVEPMIERFLRIVEAGTERLITVIEFVSPTNKRGDGLRAFRANCAEVLRSGVNFVEIDLNRAGDWRALLRPHRCPAKAESLYRATFRVPADPDATYLHPIRIRELLPAISIPLRETDPPVKLNLQALIEHAYDSGRYERRLDYTKACDPPLDAEDAAWADELLRQAGRRGTQRG